MKRDVCCFNRVRSYRGGWFGERGCQPCIILDTYFAIDFLATSFGKLVRDILVQPWQFFLRTAVG